jgi:amino acid adenylation domain-containing protein
MSTAAELLATLRQKDVKLWLDGDKLRYRAAKDTLSPELLAQLKTQKAEIIDFLKSIGAGSSSPIPPLTPGDRTGNLPLSFGQQRLWFLHQFEPDSSANNVPVVVRFNGTLNVAALEQSLNYVVSRHEVLRTTFPIVDGKPTQAICEDFTLKLAIVNLQDVPVEQREAQALQLATDEAHQPFDLAQGPNLRVLLMWLTPIEHLLIWNMNSIICDGASSDLFYQETIGCYQAFSIGQTPTLSPLSIQYADFAQWQRNWLQGEVLNKQIDYWKQKLGGNLSTIQLPFDRPRPVGVPTYQGDRAARMLPKALENSLNKLSQSWGGTLFMTLLTAFNVLLYRYSGQEDLLVSFASTGRGQAELEQSIGFFSNTLLLRTKLDGNPTFRELADRVRLDCVEAYSHQDVPFEKLVEELPSEQRSDRSPLFQVKFALNPPWSNGRGMAAVELPDLTITSLFGYIYHGQTKYDLILVMREQDEGLGMVFDYNADMFDASTIDRMLGHFQTLLEGIVANPDRLISEFALRSAALTVPVQRQLAIEQDRQSDYRSKCIHELFRAQVEQTPGAIAVVVADDSSIGGGEPYSATLQLTYLELDQRSDRLALDLQAMGVEPDTLVGICIDRSIEMLVGILGILKAGGAYVPLDPSYPAERLDFILNDTQLSLVLTQQHLVEQLPQTSARVVVLDANAVATTAIEGSKSVEITSGINSQNLAYVMFTSGSTGQPKGVSIVHQGVVRLVKAPNYVNLTTEEVFLQLAPISFDASTFEIWGCLLNGGKLILAPPRSLSIDEIGKIIQQYQVNILWLTAGLFHSIVDTKIEILQPLRQLLAGGDVLSVPQVRKFLNLVENCQLINGYGPTENTTFTCCYPIGLPLKPGESIPIGQPISGTQVYILDEQLQLVGEGIAGELYIGGDGLARGYFDRPELTTEKFIICPLNPLLGGVGVGSRLYKTGDLARYLPDGNIEFLGRIDNQVKIRGFRIELGEIEQALAQHPQVRENVVVARQQQEIGDKQLVAYIVPQADSTYPILHGRGYANERFRQFLQQRLPDYAIPSMFIILASLPLTPNGKVDRNALPEPDYLRLQPETTFIAPRNELEIQLTKIWRKVLGITAIGIRDNFFELGGHSLIAVRLFAEIEQTWGKNLPLATLFQAQTIEKMADILLERDWVAPWSSLVPIQPNGSNRPLFCIHPIGGNVLEYYPLADYLGKEQPIYGLQSQGLDGKQPPLNCVEAMASHYIKEMLAVQPHGPYAILGYSFGGLVAFEIAQQLLAAGQEIALLAILDLKSPNLAKARPSFARSILIHFQNLGQLSNREKVKYIRDRIDYRLTNKFDYKEFLIENLAEIAPPSAELLNIIDANFQAIQAYSIRPYTSNATLFRCQVQTLDYALSADLGWGELIGGNLEIFNIDSIHYGMLREPSIKVVAEKLKLCLANISAN